MNQHFQSLMIAKQLHIIFLFTNCTLGYGKDGNSDKHPQPLSTSGLIFAAVDIFFFSFFISQAFDTLMNEKRKLQHWVISSSWESFFCFSPINQNDLWQKKKKHESWGRLWLHVKLGVKDMKGWDTGAPQTLSVSLGQMYKWCGGGGEPGSAILAYSTCIVKVVLLSWFDH